MLSRSRRHLPLLAALAALLAAALWPAGVASARAERAVAVTAKRHKKAKVRRSQCATRQRRRAHRAKRCRHERTKKKADTKTASLPKPAPSWVGDYEAPAFSQWAQLDGNLAQRDRYFHLLSRPAPVFDGQHSFESVVDDGAVTPGQPGQRSMALLFPNHVPSANKSGAFEGHEHWYRTHLYFPRTFKPSPNTAWNWLVQWHNWPNGPCCPNLALAVDARGGAEKLSLRVMGGGDPAHPVEPDPVIFEHNPAGRLDWFVGDPVLKREHWYDVRVHVKWSYLPSRGYVEWWLDGRLIVSRPLATLYWYADNDSGLPGQTPGPGQAYYMEGYYRPTTLPDGSTDRSVSSVIFDGARQGPTAASIG